MEFKTWLLNEALRNPWATKMRKEYPYPHILDRYTPESEFIWYHGTQAEFQSFSDFSRPRGTTDLISYLGHHFSATTDVADRFASGLYGDESKKGRVIQARLHIENPKIYNLETDLREDIDAWQKESQAKGSKPRLAKGFVNHLRKNGYDGIVYGNTIEGGFGNECAIAFSAGQIEQI